jgi:hypothetical protein
MDKFSDTVLITVWSNDSSPEGNVDKKYSVESSSYLLLLKVRNT